MTSIDQIIGILNKYISKGGRIEAVIGHRKEIRIAPEMEVIKEAYKKAPNTQTSDADEEDDHAVVWSPESSKCVLIKDVFIALNSINPLYLYYYWDASELKGDDNSSSYYPVKAKKQDLQPHEYNDFIQLLTGLIQNVVQHKKHGGRKRKARENNNSGKISNKKDKAPQLELMEEKKGEFLDQDNCNCEDRDIDMEHPFQKMFAQSKHSSSLGCDEVLQTFSNQKLINQPNLHSQDQMRDQMRDLKKMSADFENNESMLNSPKNSILSDNESRFLGGFHAIGSATNSMLMPSYQMPAITGFNSNAFIIEDTNNAKEKMHLPPQSKASIIEEEKSSPKKSMSNNQTKKRTKNKKPEEQAQNEEFSKSKAVPDPANDFERLPHPNDAFNIYQANPANGNKVSAVDSNKHKDVVKPKP